MDKKDMEKELTKSEPTEENIQPEINQAETKNPIISSEATEETTKETEDANKSKDSIVPPADFSTIFNVESEEKPEVASKPLVEAPKVEVKKESTEENALPIDSGTTNKNPNAFNDQEKVIYEIKPEKEGNPIIVVIFFVLLLGTVFALPYVSTKLNFDNENKPTSNNTPEEDDEEESIYYFDKSSVRAKLDGLEFTNFVKSKVGNRFFVTFNITNTNNNPYQYDKKYYVTLLENEVVVYYALIHSYDVIGTNAAQEITLPISEKAYNNADRFKIEEIVTAKYPEVKLNKKEGEYEVLTCTFQNDEIKYYFVDNKLLKLYETYTESQESSLTYEQDKVNYQNLSNEYKKVENFTSTFIETNIDFRIINEIPYRDVSNLALSNLKTYKFFRYNEHKNVIAFEMKAQGYTCS